MRKVFLQCMFGTPHSWIQDYLDDFGRQEEFGFHMKVFTPNQLRVPANIEVVPMTVEEYDALLGETTGVRAGNFLKDGVPSKLISDHYCAWGQVFQEYIKGFDFWAITNFDVVYGRLDHFIPDALLAELDIWADEVRGINGIFTLFRNVEWINNLFREVPDWQRSFATHQPQAFDEVQMTVLLRRLIAEEMVRFGGPPYFPFHSYDRLIQHQPEPNVYVEPDGALIERFEDGVHYPNEKGHFGREILLFHFSKTKRWPIK